jgi:hypothetical protein
MYLVLLACYGGALRDCLTPIERVSVRLAP